MPRMESLEIGSTPADEDCAQVGTADYFTKARAECARFIELLTKKFGKPPGDAYFYTKSNPHEMGSYLEVAVKFNSNSRDEVAFAYHVENNSPRTWGDDTVVEMKEMIFDE